MAHPFELAGLGKAPFRYIGYSEHVYQACPGAPIQPGTSCDYCGQGIRHAFSVRSADGRQFKVGSDCILRVYGKSNRGAAEGDDVLRRMQAEQRRHRREAQHQRDTAAILKARSDLAAHPALLADKPHPADWAARKGMTLRDWALWMLEHAGVSGSLRAARLIAKAIG